MTARLYLCPAGSLDGLLPGARYRLDGDEGHHAATVARAVKGEELLIADGAGMQIHGTVSSLGSGWVEVLVSDVEQVPAATPQLVVVLALTKGGRDEHAVEMVTELGADVIVPWQATRSVVVWSGPRGERSAAKWRDAALAATKQSRRAWIPRLRPVVGTKDLARRVESACAAGDRVLVLDPAGAVALRDADLSAERLWLIIGPEGGIDPVELDHLQAAGAHLVSCGPTILRTPTAAAAAVAMVRSRTVA